MTCADDDDLRTDALLQRYLDGACTAEERAWIEGEPKLSARAAQMAYLDDMLRRLFVAGTDTGDGRLDPADLIGYINNTLEEERRRAIEQRLEQDPELQAEVELLRRMGDTL
jgi:anti-sigma factor RsiW